MTMEEHAQLFRDMIATPTEKINEMANTGMFNSIIEGVLRAI